MTQNTQGQISELEVYTSISQLIASGEEMNLAAYVRENAKKGSIVAGFIKSYGKSQMARGFFCLPYIEQLMYEYLCKRLSADDLLKDLKPYQSYNKWEWSYLVEACLAAYRRDTDVKFLDLAHKSIEHAFNNRDCERGLRDQIRNRVLKSWGLVGPEPNTWTTVVTVAGRIITPVLEYIDICKSTGRAFPQFWEQACFAAVNEHLDEFIVSDDEEEGQFKRISKGDLEPLNHAVSMGRALLRLGKYNHGESYVRMASQLAMFFKRSLIQEEDSYAWGYRPTLMNRLAGFPTTFWKADIDLYFVSDCINHEVVFDLYDMQRFRRTLTRAILRPGWTNCYVSRKKLETLDKKANKISARCYGLCGWMIVSTEAEDETESLLEDALFANRQHVPYGWLGVGRAALSYALKRNLP